MKPKDFEVPDSFIPDSFVPDLPPTPPSVPAVRRAAEVVIKHRPVTHTPRSYTPPSITQPAPEPGFFFPGRQAEYHRNQLADFQAKAALQMAQINHGATLELSARAIDHELDFQATRLAEANEITAVMHESSMQVHHTNITQVRASEVLIQRALGRGLDVGTYAQVRLDEERLVTELSKAKALSEIQVNQHQAMKQIDLDAEGQVNGMKIQAALTVALADKHKLLHIQDQVLKLMERSYHIQSGREPQELKSAKLEVIAEVIAGLRQELRGLLQSNSQKGLGSGNQDSNS